MNRRGFLGIVGGAVASAVVRLRTNQPVVFPKTKPFIDYLEQKISVTLFNEGGLAVAKSNVPLQVSTTDIGAIEFSEAQFGPAGSDWGKVSHFVLTDEDGEEVAFGNINPPTRVKETDNVFLDGIRILLS